MSCTNTACKGPFGDLTGTMWFVSEHLCCSIRISSALSISLIKAINTGLQLQHADTCANRDDFNKVLHLSVRATLKFNHRVVPSWWSVIIYTVDYLLPWIKSFEECYGFHISNWILDCSKFLFCAWSAAECSHNWHCFANVFTCSLNVFLSSSFQKGLARNFQLLKIVLFLVNSGGLLLRRQSVFLYAVCHERVF